MSYKRKLAERVLFASRAAKAGKATRFGIIVSAVMTFLIFAVSYYGEMTGNFTFSMDRQAQNAGITMYSDSVNKNYTTRLTADNIQVADAMTELCGTEFYDGSHGYGSVCMPSDKELALVDGSNNGNYYIDFTFYIQNVGDATVDLESQMNILSQSNDALESLRVRVIVNGIGTTYAMRQSSKGANPGELEPLTEAFYSPSEVMQQDFTTFNPGDILKVTVAVWYEGTDADHSNAIMGGGVKMDMKFTISKIYT